MAKKKRKLKLPIIITIVLIICIIIGAILFFTIGKVNIKLNGEKYITLNYNDTYNEEGATAKYLFKDINNINIFGNVDTTKIGKYEIKYEAKYSYMTSSTTRTIEVIDKKEPTLELIGSTDIKLFVGNQFKDPGYKATDEYEGVLTDKVVVNNSIDINKAGKYTITYEVQDTSGNKATAIRNIEIQDKPKTTNTSGIPVLMYHFFYDKNKENKNDGNWMEIHLFEEQMKYIQDNNYYQPTWEELIDYVDGKITLPEKSVIVTADDGNPSFFELAIPICQKYNIRCTSFIVSSWTHGDWIASTYKGKGIDFQSHTYDMHKGGCPQGHGGLFNCISHDAGVQDMTKSKTDLEQINKVYTVAYPFGDVNENVKTITKDAGFSLGFTTQFGKVRPHMDKLELPRIRVNNGVSLANFAKNL